MTTIVLSRNQISLLSTPLQDILQRRQSKAPKLPLGGRVHHIASETQSLEKVTRPQDKGTGHCEQEKDRK